MAKHRFANSYIGFLRRRRWLMIFVWVCIAAASVVFAPKFMNNTSAQFEAPSNSEAYKAKEALDTYFPGTSAQSPVLLLAESADGKSDLTDFNNPSARMLMEFTSRFERAVEQAAANGKVKALIGPSPNIKSCVGYYELKEKHLEALGRQTFVAPDLTAALIACAINGTDAEERDDTVSWIQDNAPKIAQELDPTRESGLTIRLTGEFLFYKDVIAGADKDLARVDSISLPLALVVLAYVLQSVRLMIMPVVCLGMAILSSFAIMYPISLAVDVISVAPSLMMSSCIALSIDYCLFIFSRFAEELRTGFDSDVAMCQALRTAGETVVVSGTTLCVCFMGLVMLPLKMLKTMGIGAGAAVFMSMAVSLTLLPALVFAFPRFFGNALNDSFYGCFNSVCTVFGRFLPCGWCKYGSGGAWRLAPGGSGRNSGERGGRLSQRRGLMTSLESSLPQSHVRQHDIATKLPRSIWYRITCWTVRRKWVVLIVLLASAAPFAWKASTMVTTSSITMSVPRDATSLAVFNAMESDFGAGAITPYTVLMSADNQSAAVTLTPGFWGLAAAAAQAVADVDPALDPVRGMSGPVWFNGRPVGWSEFENATQAVTVKGQYTETQFTIVALTMMGKSDHGALKLTVQCPYDPFVREGVAWLKGVRAALKTLEAEPAAAGVSFYVANGATEQVDAIDLVYDLLPVEMGVTAGVVFLIMSLAFRSVIVPLRSILSIGLTLSWTYGIVVLIYNEGMLDFLGWPALAKYSGVTWFAPVMCFSVLTGFALDYDIFLLTRIVEYREMGYTLLASIKLAVYKTGGIITAAGCIMAIAFGGLLFSTMPLLNMCSFFIVWSVLFDTFVVRTVLVPAAMAILSDFNFWPRRLPPGVSNEMDAAGIMGDQLFS